MEINIYKLSTCVYSTKNAIFSISDNGSVEHGHRSEDAGNQTIVSHTEGYIGVLFNLCKNNINFTFVEEADPSFGLNRTILQKCRELSQHSYAYSFDTLLGECHAYDMDYSTLDNYHQYVDATDYSDSFKVTGLQLNYTNRDTNRSLIINNTCSQDDANQTMKFVSANVTDKSIVFSFTSGSGCATFSLNVIFRFIE